MLKTQFIIAFRQLWKRKTSSLINMLGLSLGLTAFILILQYVAFEWSYNRMYERSEHIFRVLYTQEDGGVFLPPGAGPVLKEQFSDIQEFTRILPGTGNGVYRQADKADAQIFREEQTAFVDASFLSMFERDMIAGSGDLSAPQTLALSERVAQKYFGNEDPIGKQISVDNQFGNTIYEVAGVFEDFPPNSDINYDILLSIQTLVVEKNRNGNGWADPNGLNSAFSNIFVELAETERSEALATAVTAWAAESFPEESLSFGFQPLSELHLGRDLNDPLPTFGNRLFVLFFFIVSVIILLIAWVNYVNLSTAQAMERAKEVGIRKVIGANKHQLVRHYLLETFILTLLASLIAIEIVSLVQPMFNEMVSRPLSFSVLLNSPFIWVGLAIILLGSILSGTYVAFGLTAFPPIQMLKGSFKSSSKGIFLRKALVVGQFAISIGFIASTLILIKQLDFLYNRNLGIEVEQKLVLEGPDVKTATYEVQRQAFREQIAQLPFVKHYCSSGYLPGKGVNFTASGMTKENAQPGDEDIPYRILMIDENYTTTLGMKVVAGRSFDAEEAIKGWEADKLMLNEIGARSVGFESPGDAIGKTVNWYNNQWEIVGVINDYNHQSLRSPIEPMAFLPSRSAGFFVLEMNTENFQTKIAEIEKLYQKSFPGNPFQFEFLDETYAQLYLEEQRLSSLFTTASLLAIFISVLGLFGLVSFVAQQKTKEIGIRKVLGASVGSIVSLLSKDFMVLVLVAILIACPLAWYISSKWLENFAFQTELSWWVFGLAATMAIFIAFTTMALRGIYAARANPIVSLRSE